MLDAHRQMPDGRWVDRALAAFGAANEAYVARTESLLGSIVGDDSLHPKMLNTLSMLEHMGSQKIMATQHGTAVDQATLRHVAEECHHAFFMKRQAEKAAGRSMTYTTSDLLALVPARMYFQRLEAQVVRELGDDASGPQAPYLYMSMIVEFRAVWFYSLYQQVLRRHSHVLSLKRLLGEEQNHLTDMAERLEHIGALSDTRAYSLMRAECALYGRLLDSLQQSVN